MSTDLSEDELRHLTELAFEADKQIYLYSVFQNGSANVWKYGSKSKRESNNNANDDPNHASDPRNNSERRQVPYTVLPSGQTMRDLSGGIYDDSTDGSEGDSSGRPVE